MSNETIKIENDFENAVNENTAFNDDDIRDITDALHDGDSAKVTELVDDLSD